MTDKAQNFSAEILETAEDIERFMPQWKEFLTHAPAPHYYQDMDRVLIEKRYRKFMSRIVVVVVSAGDEIALVLPLLHDVSPFKLSFGLLTLGAFRVDRHKLLATEILVSRDVNRSDCLRYLGEFLISQNGRFDLCLAEALPENSTLFQMRDELSPFKLKPLGGVSNVVWELHLHDTHDEYLKTFKYKTRYNLKRRVRQLSDEFAGDWELVKCETAGDVGRFLDASETIFERSWKKGVLGEKLGYTRDEIDCLEQLAHKGWFRGYVLFAGGRPLAFCMLLQYGGRCILEDLAYDQAYAKLGPGSVTLFHVIEDLHRNNPPEILDFGFGDNSYKRVYSNVQYPASDTYLVKAYSKAWMLVSMQSGLQRLYQLLRDLSVTLKLDHTMRRLIRRGGQPRNKPSVRKAAPSNVSTQQ